MSPLTNYDAWKARAAFEAGKYPLIVQAADRRAPADPECALWAARAYVEEDRFEAAERLLLPFVEALPAAPFRAHVWAQISFARLMRGCSLDEIGQAIAAAAAEGAEGPAALLRAMLAVPEEKPAGALAIVNALPPCDDPYFAQLRRNTTTAVVSSTLDEAATADAIKAFAPHLARHGGLHFLAWSLFAIARAQCKVGWHEAGRATLAELDALFALGFGARLRRAVGLLREAAEERGAIEFCPIGKNHCEEVPRNFETTVAARTQLPANLAKRPVLAQLYATLLAAGDAGMTKDDLFRHLWGSRYDPLRHEARLYKSLARLREALIERGDDALVAVGARYLIKPAPGAFPQ